MTDAPLYRDLVRDMLAVSGPAAVAMLSDQATVDPLVILGALGAAGLLDAVTAEDHAELREAVIQAALTSTHTAGAIGLIDLDAARIEAAGDEPGEAPEDRLSRQLDLAGVVEASPRDHTTRLARFLDEQKGMLMVEPEFADGLATLADQMLDELDLPSRHPASALLEAVLVAEGMLADEAEQPTDPGLIARGIEKARRQLARRSWGVFFGGLHVDQVSLADVVAAPIALAAAGDDLPPMLELARDGDHAVALIHAGERLQVAWTGPGLAPQALRLGKQELEPAPSPFPEARSWWLPAEAPTKAALSLIFRDRTWTLRPAQ